MLLPYCFFLKRLNVRQTNAYLVSENLALDIAKSGIIGIIGMSLMVTFGKTIGALFWGSRIPRHLFWLLGFPVFLSLSLICAFYKSTIFLNISMPAEPLLFLVLLFLIWMLLSIQIQRLHDVDKSGWMMLLPLIPLIGLIWLLVVLGFKKGTKGVNKYGDDPLEPAPRKIRQSQSEQERSLPPEIPISNS